MSDRPRTLYEKIWDAHVVERRDDGTCLIYIDRHLVHEVTSPQAFEGLRAGRAQGAPARPDAGRAPTTISRPRRASTPTAARLPIADPASAEQLAALEANVAEFGVPYIDDIAAEQGIVHVVGPGAGLHPAGHHPGLRRQPHRGARRARRAGLRHRHQRGRACARHPDPAAEAVEDDGDPGRRRRSASASRPRT